MTVIAPSVFSKSHSDSRKEKAESYREAVLLLHRAIPNSLDEKGVPFKTIEERVISFNDTHLADEQEKIEAWFRRALELTF